MTATVEKQDGTQGGGAWQIVEDGFGYPSIYGTDEDGRPGDLIAHTFADHEHMIRSAPDMQDALLSAAAAIDDLQSALHDVLNLVDYVRCTGGSLPLSGPSRLVSANALLRSGASQAARAALSRARGETA